MTPNHRKAGVALALAGVLAVVAGCGKSADTVTGGSTAAGGAPATTIAPAPTNERQIATPAPTGDYNQPVVWGVYRETNSLDPIFAFDYPENTVLFNICEAIQEQQPDGSIADGLGTIATPDPTTYVITLKDGVKFWDGTPMTSEDVVYSLDRARNPKLGGFYPQVFARVKDIKATAPNVVTITLTEPDTWLKGELSGPAGVVVEKAYVEAKGQKYGTVDGGAMCTGPFKLDSWKTGEGVTLVKNDAYWNPSKGAHIPKITFKGYPDDAAVTSALLTGELTGYYPLQLTTLDQLKQSSEVKVYQGPSTASDAMIVSSFKGALGDARVRQALSMAIDRQPLIDQLYKGAAQLPRALSNPGTWGYSPDVFKAGWDALPEPKVDLAGAKALIQQAGATGKTVTLGTSAELIPLNTEAQAMQSAAEAIGLKAKLKSVSAANYINFFIDPEARKDVDGFFTINYGDYADPAALLSTLVMKGGSQNYAGYDNPAVTTAMNAARSEPDDAKRAQDVVDAQAQITKDVAWVAMAAPDTVLVMNKAVTGAPASFVYMFGPWATSLGAAG